MRDLTLDEKIGIKGVLAFKGLALPALTMKDAVYFWNMACPGTIARWFLHRNHFRNRP